MELKNAYVGMHAHVNVDFYYQAALLLNKPEIRF